MATKQMLTLDLINHGFFSEFTDHVNNRLNFPDKDKRIATLRKKQSQLLTEVNSEKASESSKPIKPYSSPYSGEYADTHLKDNLLAKQLLSFLSDNPELGNIKKMLDGIERNGHAHWAERSITTVVDHLVKNERYDDAKTFIHGITFKDGEYADTHLKDNLISKLPVYKKLSNCPRRMWEEKMSADHHKAPFKRI